MNIEEVEAFVNPDYVNKDIMHNLTHIHRIIKLATAIGNSYEHNHLI
ncbi:hypothetical protein NIES4101_36060 [Calothrix sp. NIES-4101]|nr:hypothetical protein NIES4101_36060 [Calothrix sp. NIES-4101]